MATKNKNKKKNTITLLDFDSINIAKKEDSIIAINYTDLSKCEIAESAGTYRDPSAIPYTRGGFGLRHPLPPVELVWPEDSIKSYEKGDYIVYSKSGGLGLAGFIIKHIKREEFDRKYIPISVPSDVEEEKNIGNLRVKVTAIEAGLYCIEKDKLNEKLICALSVPENFACNGIIGKPGDFIIRDSSGRQEVCPNEKFHCRMVEIAGNKEVEKALRQNWLASALRNSGAKKQE